MAYPKLMDQMVGKIFNDWLVLQARPNDRKGFVLAKCVCGKIKEVRGRSLKDNSSKNCGCKKGLKMRGVKKREDTDSAKTAIYSIYKTRAIRSKKDFTLTFKEFIDLTQKICYYCNNGPSNKILKHKYSYLYNGLDRVDNSKGYTIQNVVPCCGDCNTKKGSITKEMIRKAYEFLF